MTYEAKSKKLNNEDMLPTLDDVLEDQRLLAAQMKKRIQDAGNTVEDFYELVCLLICSLTAGNGKR